MLLAAPAAQATLAVARDDTAQRLQTPCGTTLMDAHGSHARRGTDRSAVGAAERRRCATLAVPVAVPLTMAGVFADAARPVTVSRGGWVNAT